jgi:transposase
VAALTITAEERSELQTRRRTRSLPAADVQRAAIILRLADGMAQNQIARELGCAVNTVRLWAQRFAAARLAGLAARHQGRKPKAETPGLEARILALTRGVPKDGSTHWSTRKIARLAGTNAMRVARVWAKAGLQPHRLRGYVASDDPDFETKAADVIGLYLNPPANAVVFCVDEKTAIQALDRLDPVLPLSPGRVERHGFEYYRHGTLSLYAALNTRTGQVLGKTAKRHTSAEFIGFLRQILDGQPPGQEIHVIVDNLSAHKTKAVTALLEEHPRLRLHFTPTYSSWLNQIELWFSKIERDVIARGVFESVTDLRRKIMRYIRLYNRHARPLHWTYRHTRNPMPVYSDSNVTVH